MKLAGETSTGQRRSSWEVFSCSIHTHNYLHTLVMIRVIPCSHHPKPALYATKPTRLKIKKLKLSLPQNTIFQCPYPPFPCWKRTMTIASTNVQLPILPIAFLVQLNSGKGLVVTGLWNSIKCGLLVLFGNLILTNLKDVSGYNFVRAIVGNSFKKKKSRGKKPHVAFATSVSPLTLSDDHPCQRSAG